MAKHKVTLRARGEEIAEEVELEFPFYTVDYESYGTVYKKYISPDKEVGITEAIGILTDGGYRPDDSYEVEVSKPSFWSSDTMEKLKKELSSDLSKESEFNDAVMRMNFFLYKHAAGDGQ